MRSYVSALQVSRHRRHSPARDLGNRCVVLITLTQHLSIAHFLTLLKGLLLAKRMADHIQGRLESVTLHITLGVPPHVNVEIH